MKYKIVLFVFFIIIPLSLLSQTKTSNFDEECNPILNFLKVSIFNQESTSNELKSTCNKNELILYFENLNKDLQINLKVFYDLINEKEKFYGLASYYNSPKKYIFNDNSSHAIKKSTKYQLNKFNFASIIGRYDAFILEARGVDFFVDDEYIFFNNNKNTNTQLKIKIEQKVKISEFKYDSIRYSHLWNWLRYLSKNLEKLLIFFNNNFYSNWAFSIFLIALLIKIVFIPLNIVTFIAQRNVYKYKSILAPKLLLIKNKYDGEKAHHLIMKAHRDLGISPFFSIKPILLPMIQVPILIAMFNVLGEMPQLKGASFLWITDFAYSDYIYVSNFTLPFFGNKISILPILMSLITIYSAFLLKIKTSLPVIEIKKQKYNLYLMSFAFFILFYPFPSAMLFYWTIVNMLQFVQQIIFQNITTFFEHD